jgi:RimJ/RimL family protein N-acetyltransferase
MPALILETPRLLLRQWRDSDVEEWVRMGSDPRVMQFFPSLQDRERAVQEARRLGERLQQNGYGWWVIDVKGGPSFAGVIALHVLPDNLPFRPTREIAWRLRFDAWGKGYATEGARVAIEHAFNALDWPEIISMTSVLNVRSQRVMQRLGMTHDESDNFEHPSLEPGHPLRPHLIYRLKRVGYAQMGPDIT